LPPENLPLENLPSEDLPSEDLPSEDLPSEDLPPEDLPPADLPGDGFALCGGLLAVENLASADVVPEGLPGGDLARRGFMNIGTSAVRCLRKRRACFADVLRARERAIKPHTHRTCPDDFCSRRHLSRAFPLAEHQTKYVLK
jgi:hypothetical protein